MIAEQISCHRKIVRNHRQAMREGFDVRQPESFAYRCQCEHVGGTEIRTDGFAFHRAKENVLRAEQFVPERGNRVALRTCGAEYHEEWPRLGEAGDLANEMAHP